MSSNTEAYLALAGTLFGGAGLKLLESALGRKKQEFDQSAAVRSELRVELNALKAEAEKLHVESDKLRDEIDLWRSRYYSLVASVAKGDEDGAIKKIEDDEKSI
jgi:cell division protein FtsB